ncbi:MAG: penicillin-binding transpeptidase domain-containing protein, partial [Myxococcota bacterium]|nr:penicillin-binding transpeptidase domain-containing protein [Myxococcota bacterium]
TGRRRLGIWDLEDGDKAKKIKSSEINDTHVYDMATSDPVFGLKTSSNIVYGQMGLDLGAERLYRYLRSFGLGQTTGVGFPGESQGLLRSPESKPGTSKKGWAKVDTVNIAFGQGVSATGVQLVSALAALGNGGVRMKPLLIRRVLSADGREIQTWEPTVIERAVSKRTANTVLDVMATVVEPGGTGMKAYIPEYPVAGKTGTGQKPHLRKKGYAENMWVATFFGVAPLDDPQLAVLVLVDEPKGKRYGGVVAAPVFREIMRGALRHLGVPSPFDDAHQVAALDPDQLAQRRSKPRAVPKTLVQAAPPLDPDAADDVSVPDFVGMTIDQVTRTASEVGLSVQYVGTGSARSQDLAPHERVRAWSEITIVFEPRAPDASLAAHVNGLAPGGPQTHQPPTPRTFLGVTP